MNKTILIGNICNDLEIKESGETKILSFNIAAQRKLKNKDGKYESDFIRVKCFNQQALFVEKYFKKGSKIVVEGRLQSSTWDDEQGVKHYSLDVIAEAVEFAGSKSQSDTQAPTNLEDLPVNVVNTTADDDLPF